MVILFCLIPQLENERKLGLRDREAERAQFEHRIHDLSQYINKMDETQESILKELEAAKTGQRKAEQKWTSEKETLLRKLQFVQHYGTVLPSRELEGGFFTDKRGEARRTADGKAQRQLQVFLNQLLLLLAIFEIPNLTLFGSFEATSHLLDQS